MWNATDRAVARTPAASAPAYPPTGGALPPRPPAGLYAQAGQPRAITRAPRRAIPIRRWSFPPHNLKGRTSARTRRCASKDGQVKTEELAVCPARGGGQQSWTAGTLGDQVN